jgi:hypothetical protein
MLGEQGGKTDRGFIDELCPDPRVEDIDHLEVQVPVEQTKIEVRVVEHDLDLWVR